MKKTFVLILAVLLILFAMVCSVAGEGGEDCKHQWVIESSKPATCTETGNEEYICKRCGKTNSVTIPALGHEWGRCEMIQASTCTEEGLIRCYCSRDEYHVKEDALPALGHDWGEWYIQKKQSLTEKGIRARYCGRCGAIERQDISPRIRHESYELILFLSMDAEMRTQEDGLPAIDECGLANTGKEDLWIRQYGTGSEGELLQTEKEWMLPAGKAIHFPLNRDRTGVTIESSEQNPSELFFVGETKEGEQMCISQTVTVTGSLFPEMEDEISLDNLQAVTIKLK